MPFPNDTFTNPAVAQSALQTRMAAAGMTPDTTFNNESIITALLANLLTDLPSNAATGSIAALKLTSNSASGATTAAAGDLTGAAITVATYSAVGAANLQTRTATQMIADAGLRTGSTYLLIIRNTSGGTTTLTAGAGVTLSGTMTMATNTYRLFAVTVQSISSPALTITNLGSGSV